MVRTLTANAQSKADTIKGTEPIVIIKAEWPSGTIYYADKTVTVGAISAVGRILDLGGIDAQVKTDSSGQVSGSGVTLDDSDGTLKTLVDEELIEGSLITVYLHYIGNAQADLITLLKGKAAADIVWDEGERTLAFNIESDIHDTPIGFAPQAGDMSNLDDDAIGVPWPICFGKPLRVPTVQVRKQIRGSLKEDVDHTTPTPSFQVENGNKFPQGTPIAILVKGIKMTGSFSGDAFTPTSRNDAIETSLAIAARVAGAYQNDYSVFWLSDSSVNIEGQYVIVNDGGNWMVNFVESQVGTRCHCRKDWMYDLVIDGSVNKVLLDSGDTISETAGWPRGSWATTYKEYNWYWTVGDDYLGPNFTRIIGFSETRKDPDGYKLLEGDPVIYDGGYNDLYVANLIQSTDILEVYGHRSFNSDTILAPIPSSYYTVNTNHLLAGQNCTTIEFPKALVDYECEGWQGDVFVSLVSTADQNVSNIIKWLIQTYTSLSIDSTTFNAVKADLRDGGGDEKYPANFAIFDQPGCITVCEQIAWQSRCALIIDGGVAYLKYLSEIPSSDYTADESAIEMKTLELGFTPTDDLVTHINANWKSDLSGEDGTEKIFVYKNNIATYGTIIEDMDFFIYNIESLVELSAAFWGYRLSNVWRKAAFQSFMPAIELQPFDTVLHDLEILGANSLRGVVQQANLDTQRPSIGLETVIASKSGDESGGEPTEDTKYWTGDPSYSINGNPVPTDPSTGLDEVDYEVEEEEGCREKEKRNKRNDRPGVEDLSGYKLHFIEGQLGTPRSTNFGYKLALLDTDGNQVSRTIEVELTLEATDPNDTYNHLGNITLQNGLYTEATGQITGGAADDTVTIKATPTNKQIQGASIGMRVWDGTAIAFTVPASVIRGTNFTVSATGPASQTVPVTIEGTDASDSLNKANITFDGSGNYSANDWQVTGGSGKQSFRIGATYSGNNNVSDPITIYTSSGEVSGGGVTLSDDIPIIISEAGSAPSASTSARRSDVVPGLELVGTPTGGAALSYPTLEFATSSAGLQVRLMTSYTSVKGLIDVDAEGLYVKIAADSGIQEQGSGLEVIAGDMITVDSNGVGLTAGANGDVLYYNSGWQRRAKGTDGHVLTLVSGLPQWQAGGGSVSYWDSTPSTVIGTKGSAGTSSLVSRGDHDHPFDGTNFAGYTIKWYYGAFEVDDSTFLDGSGVRKVDTTGNSPGIGTVAAPADHKHGFDGTLFAGTGISWATGQFHAADLPGSGTEGDMLYWDGGSGAWVALAVGASDQVLLSDGSDPYWGDPVSPLTAGDGIDISSDVVSVDLATNPGLQFTSNKLDTKLKSGGGLAKDSSGLYVVWE